MKGKTVLLLLTVSFFITEVFFNYIVLTNGNGDLFGASTKTLLFLLFILLFSKKINWAKWILSIALILYGLILLLVGFELMPAFYIIGVFDIFFGIYIHKSKALGIYRIVNNNTTQPEGHSDTTDNKQIFSPDSQKFQYPLLVRRFKALFIDGMLLMFILIMIMIIVQDSEMRTPVMVTSAVILLLTYEPFLTSYSKTVGQRLMKLRVGRHENPSERINLANAYVRWFTKGFLGWISFITIHFNSERRAIHDLVSDSVMICDE